MTKKRAAILGSSGMIGQRFSHMLDGHPYFDIVAYCASDRSEGKRLSDVWKLPDIELDPNLGSKTITTTDAKALAKEGVEVVFSGLPSEVAGPVEDACAEEGLAFSSRNISILPCPSSLVTGSIVIFLSFVFTVASLMIGPAILCHPFLPRSLTVLYRGDFGSVNA